MQKIWNSLTSMDQFLRLEAWKRTQLGSLMPWQANGMIISLWIALKLCFQFWIFWTKMQSWLSPSGAASRFWALGFASDLCMGWIRVEFWVQKSLHWCMEYLIFHEYFSNLFHVILIPIMANLSNFVVHEILRFYGENMLQKEIGKHDFLF